MTGRIDVHSHLLPGIDDGCESVAESLACAKRMVAAGYTHSFVTPHVWPTFINIHVDSVPQWTAQLQQHLDRQNIPLKLLPGGEINLIPGTMDTPPKRVITYGMAGKYALIDLWAERLPDFFDPAIRWLQSIGITVILAHPERMRAVQDNPDLADHFEEMGMLLQGNLQCLADPPTAATCRTVQRFLLDGRYFMLGSDLHKLDSLQVRLDGLERAIELVGDQAVNKLTIENPRKLLSAEG